MNPDMSITTIARVVAMHTSSGVHEAGHLGIVNLEIRYWVADPHAVHLIFTDDDSADTATWSFARDLLRDGLSRHAGAGDVQVFPVRGVLPSFGQVFGQVGIRLRGCQIDDDGVVGETTVEVPVGIVRAAVIRMYDLVPDGRERIGWDAELAALLGGAR